ncbi:hypothetical protein DL98DRAFT_588751 [Cadophora sp. DSE1049]|nr:hypothetical protein DL98DRAFT_588751 [Cadophora sp. DSE1049]
MNNSPQSPTTVPSKFHLFPLLPPELRSKVYILAHPPPRTITLSLPNYERKPSYIPAPLSLTSGFAHLLVNREARDVFLSEYKKVFVGYPFPARKNGRGEGRGRGWYFSYEKDSLGLMSGIRGLQYFLRRFPGDMRGVRWLDVRPTGHCGVALDDLGMSDDHDLNRNLENVEEDDRFDARFGLGMELRQPDMTELKLITIRILPSSARRLYEFQSWCYAPYYRECVGSIVMGLRRGKGERGRDVKVALCHEMVTYDDTDSFAGMKTKALSAEVKERLRGLGVLGPGCGAQRVGGELAFDDL